VIKWVLTYDGVPPVALFSGTEGQGTPLVVDSLTDTPYYLKGNVVTSFASGGGSGTVITSGLTTVDFGAGGVSASTVITGQAGILAGSMVKAWIAAIPTPDHSADEHWLETISVMAGNIIPGTGFTIYAKNTNTKSTPVEQTWQMTRLAGPGTGVNQVRPAPTGGKGTRLFGEFTVGWEWY